MDVPRVIQDGAARYVLGELLGRGSSGSVFAAVRSDGVAAAVKILHTTSTTDADDVERFAREARYTMRIDSPFVARVLGAGRTRRGSPWIATERLFGLTLEQHMQAEIVLSAPDACVVLEQVLHGVKSAHAAGIVHRDVKMSNVILARSDHGVYACLVDFGIAKFRPPPGVSASTQAPITRTADQLGTVRYMAPEQIEDSSRVDARVDLYAVGVMAYRILTGVFPFVGHELAIMHAKLEGEAPPLAWSTGLPFPRLFKAFFRRALARRPKDRFQSADEMLAALPSALGEGVFPNVVTLREHLTLATAEDDATMEDRRTDRR